MTNIFHEYRNECHCIHMDTSASVFQQNEWVKFIKVTQEQSSLNGYEKYLLIKACAWKKKKENKLNCKGKNTSPLPPLPGLPKKSRRFGDA